jgi:hypothetical protein
MRKLFVLMLALGVGQAFADDCTDLARRFVNDRNSLKIGELDDLKSCISDIEQAKAQVPDAPKAGHDGSPAASQVSAADPVSLPVSP